MIDRGVIRPLVRDVLTIARERELTLLAAGVAFYAFLSLVPIALLAVGVGTSLGGEALISRLSGRVAEFLTPSAQELLADALVDDTGRRGATLVGAIGIVWGSSRVFRGLDRAFSVIYGAEKDESLVESFWDAGVVAGAIAGGLVLITIFEYVVATVALPGTSLVGSMLVLPGLILAFLPLYVVFPEADVSPRDALPGTAVAAVGWLVLSRTFAVYATFAARSAIYGALGGVLLVLVWLYLGAIVVVLGAAVNAILAGDGMDRQLQSPGSRQFARGAMTDDATDRDDEPSSGDVRSGGSAADAERTRDRADDAAVLREDLERLRDELDDLEAGVEQRTVEREAFENELKRYVRRRVRRGHAHGWGPYLVLLYGTAMTIAAYYFLDSGWAILAMFVIWTSTLGVYLLMVLFGTAISVLGVPGRLRDWIGEWRS